MKVQQDNLRYPIGQFEYGKSYSLDDTRKHIKVIAKYPKDLKNLLKKLKSGDLEKTYRPEGWTVRQIVNHIADSHINAYVRVKLAVTEPTPIIKPYEEQLWAELEDGKHGSIKTSVKLLTALHKRWTNFLKSLQEDDLEKAYYHPASKKTVSIQEAIALYVWHGHHHLAHIQLVVEGKSQNVGSKKAQEETDKKQSKNDKSAEAPAKRSITPEHREKIRAAQMARHAKNAASATSGETTAAPAAKRGRKPGVKSAVDSAAQTATSAPKRGRKPGVKAAADAGAQAATSAPKRGRKPGVKSAASETQAVTSAPKRGRKPGVKAVSAATTDAPAKRKRRTKAEMEAARSGQTTAAKSAATSGEAPKRRGLSPERMAEIRAKRGQNKAAETTSAATTSETAAKPAKTGKASKAAISAATAGDAAPKKRGLSPERMAEIRARRGQNKAAETASAATTTETAAKPAKTGKASKAAKSAATSGDATPKKRGLSPERMAEIRARRGQNKAAETTSAATTTETAAKPAKTGKASKAVKPAATSSDAPPKRRGLSPEKMAEIRAKRGQNKAAESTSAATTTETTVKPAKTGKASKAAKPAETIGDPAPKKRGLSAERMAEVRARRGQNKDKE